MSGGHWNYIGQMLGEDLCMIACDPEVQRRFPMFASTLNAIALAVPGWEHQLDWDLSHDSPIDNDADWDKKALIVILEAALKAAPDEWFPRGKWATIQAVQQRANP